MCFFWFWREGEGKCLTSFFVVLRPEIVDIKAEYFFSFFHWVYLGSPASLKRFYFQSGWTVFPAVLLNTRTSRAGQSVLPPQQRSILDLPVWHPWLSLSQRTGESWETERGQSKRCVWFPNWLHALLALFQAKVPVPPAMKPYSAPTLRSGPVLECFQRTGSVCTSPSLHSQFP